MKFIVTEKGLGEKYLFPEIILGNKILFPWMISRYRTETEIEKAVFQSLNYTRETFVTLN